MRTIDVIAAWLFIVVLLAAGSYGVWQSINATEFTARTIHGLAKYKYHPKWYQRLWHLAGSLMLLSIALFIIFYPIVRKR